MNAIQNNIQTRKLNKKRAEMMDDFIRKHKTGGNGQNNQSQGIPNGYTQSGNGIGANANGVYGVQPNQNGIVAQGRNSVNMQDNPYNVTQMGNMPNLEGGRFNGRIPQSDGVFFQGSQNVGFPTNVDNVTQMGNLYNSNNREVDRYPQELAGLTGEDLQRAGLAYNQRVDSGFGRAIQNADVPVRQSTVYNTPSSQGVQRYIPQEQVRSTPIMEVPDPSIEYPYAQQNGVNPMIEVPDPSVQYPMVANQVSQQQVAPQQSSGYEPITDFYDHNKKIRDEISEKYFPEGIGVKYNADPNNPSVLDKLVDWYRGW